MGLASVSRHCIFACSNWREIQLMVSSTPLESTRKDTSVLVTLANRCPSQDLLNSRAPFSILEDSFGDTQLAGIKEHQIDSVEVLLQLIEEATSFRKTAATVKNDNSSRSHAICRLRIAHPPTTPLEDGILYLIDLAGSESARDMAPQDSDRQKESREINISLSVLKDCIRGVASMNPTGKASAKKTYIPFRQSMLTKVLKHVFDSFGNRHCQTAVIACINPSFLDTGASKNTLRYAEMLQSAQLVRKPLPYDPTNPKTWTNQDLQKWIRDNVSNRLSGRAICPC